METGGERLVGWKAIAAHLGRDERTAKRWETTRAMPVHRVAGGANASVYARRDELNDWLQRPGRGLEAEPSLEPGPGPGPGPEPEPEPEPSLRRRRWPWAVGAAGAATALMVLASSPAPAPRRQARTPNAGSADAYFAGVHALGMRTPSGISAALHDFQRAVARDPGYAPAHVGLADAYALAREVGTMPDAVAYPAAEREARTALKLDPGCAGAHRVLGFALFWYRHDAAGADREFRAALAAAPDDARTHHWWANILSDTGRIAEGLAEIDRARALDPESTAIQADRALIVSATDLKGARAELERLAALDPATPGPPEWESRMALQQHDGAGYVRLARNAARLRGDADELALADAAADGLRRGGWPALLDAMLRETERQHAAGRTSDYHLAQVLAVGGDTERAAAVLSRALAAHDPHMANLLGDSMFAAVRAGHPELVRAARQQLELPA